MLRTTQDRDREKKKTGDSTDGDENSHDPLAESMSCICFDSSNNDLKAALSDILERFKSDQCYRNDERYLKLWMRYADLTDDANKVFLLLESEGIGMQLSLFWVAWAYVLETAEEYKKAARTIAEGRARGALPVSLLEEFQCSFHQRMLNRMHMVGLDPQEGNDVEAEIGAAASTWRSEQATLRESNMYRTAAQAQREQHPDGPNRSGRAPTEEVETRRTGDGAADGARSPRDESFRLADAFLRARDVNSRNENAARGEWCTPGDRPERVSQVPANGNKTATINTVTLVRDPFSPGIRRRFTTNTARYLRWISSSNIVHDTRADSLAKRWPRQMAKVNVGSRKPVALARTLGNQRMDVLGVLGEGAFATVFSCKVSKDQRDLAVKVERQEDAPSLPWECFITIQLSERLSHCHQRKGDSVFQPPVLVMKPEALFLYQDGCAMTMPQGPSGTLHDLVALYAKKAQTVPQLVAMHYAVEMLRYCRAMHSVSILHMDIKPDNWLLTRRPRSEVNRTEGIKHARDIEHSLALIDFGKAIDLSIFPQNGSGMAFMGQCCPSNFSCPAMAEGTAWKHDADLYALGSCVYFMLHGVYLKVSCEQEAGPDPCRSGRWRPAKNCRRYWEVDLWDNLLRELLNSDYRATGVAGTDDILHRLEESLASHLDDYHRSRELKEYLRKQDNMLSNR